jgi:hypothetical protein
MLPAMMADASRSGQYSLLRFARRFPSSVCATLLPARTGNLRVMLRKSKLFSFLFNNENDSNSNVEIYVYYDVVSDSHELATILIHHFPAHSLQIVSLCLAALEQATEANTITQVVPTTTTAPLL